MESRRRGERAGGEGDHGALRSGRSVRYCYPVHALQALLGRRGWTWHTRGSRGDVAHYETNSQREHSALLRATWDEYNRVSVVYLVPTTQGLWQASEGTCLAFPGTGTCRVGAPSRPVPPEDAVALKDALRERGLICGKGKRWCTVALHSIVVGAVRKQTDLQAVNTDNTADVSDDVTLWPPAPYMLPPSLNVGYCSTAILGADARATSPLY